MIHWLFAG